MDGCSAVLVVRTRGLVYDSSELGVEVRDADVGPFFGAAIRRCCSVIKFWFKCFRNKAAKKAFKNLFVNRTCSRDTIVRDGPMQLLSFKSPSMI